MKLRVAIASIGFAACRTDAGDIANGSLATIGGPSDSTHAGDGSQGSGSQGSTADGGSAEIGGTTAESSGGPESATTTAGVSDCLDYLFCEDFELGAPGEMPPGWTERPGWDQGGSRAVLTADEYRGGTQSLRSAVGTNGQYRVEYDLSMLGDARAHHWGRIFYKVKTPVVLDGIYIHNTFVAFGRPESENGSESRIVDTVMAPDGTHQFLFNVPDDSCCAGSSYDYAYDDAWHCVEWYVEASSASFRFFYDGNEVTDLAFEGNAGAHIEAFTSIIVGWINYQSPSLPNEGWFDDLAIDDSRIGC